MGPNTCLQSGGRLVDSFRALLVAMGQTNWILHERYFGDSRERRPGQSQRTNSSSSL